LFKRILVPLDGSKNAEKVLPIVVAEAKHHGAVIVLLRIIAPLRQSLMTSPSIIDQAYKHIGDIARDYLEEVADRFRREDLEVEVHIIQGLPARRTLEFAQESACDLIVIGTHGETGASQWRFGGIANKVIKAKSSIPMLVISTID
jgi:nucleotide-binding universal stress UspA family protein